ncbi:MULTISPECIES: DoxX family protein [Saccharothrix]|uniref:DoxX family protein n=1 Tax=Saccharothrix TaxID=2071 RepID=UPI00093AFB94|nr:DoxX family protein [Saccharothrix sp. CB00851]OKI27182.1 hypothetical protein A6A25_08185 [Saccharothrix sp. CB00851]
MHLAHLVAASLPAVALTYSAALDFARDHRVLAALAAARVPAGLLPLLGAVKALAVAGILAGYAVPPLGLAAVTGVVLFFAAAIATHLRVGDHRVGLPSGFGLLAAATLTLGLLAA